MRQQNRTPPFKEGDRIELVSMPDDPDPIPPGTRGTVEAVTDLYDSWQVLVKWDVPRSLTLCIPPDIARKVSMCTHPRHGIPCDADCPACQEECR